jgi:hypothetical protein
MARRPSNRVRLTALVVALIAGAAAVGFAAAGWVMTLLNTRTVRPTAE